MTRRARPGRFDWRRVCAAAACVIVVGFGRVAVGQEVAPEAPVMTDFERSLSIGALEMDPGDPMVLLAGANDFFDGGGTGGLFRSTDTRATWIQITGGLGTGLPFGTVDDLAGEPGNTSRLYVALQGRGIYRTDDTGATWTQVSNNDAALNTARLGSTNTRIAVAGDSRAGSWHRGLEP
jgi:hypothetical protein